MARLLWLLLMAMVGGVVSGAAAMTMSKVSLTLRPPASVRVVLMLRVLAGVLAGGVPLNSPVLAFRVSQLGSGEPSARVAL